MTFEFDGVLGTGRRFAGVGAASESRVRDDPARATAPSQQVFTRRPSRVRVAMTFVTRLTLQSGDRAALDGLVDDIKATAERKGAALKGPHSHPPENLSVPQHCRLHADDDRRFDSWEYTVFTRELEIHGHDQLARDVASWEFPNSIHVEAEVEQIHGAGRGK